jgi:NADH:ubiquinone oxidoreductase subunit 4 (subunit M)
MFLVPIFFILSLYSFLNWAYEKVILGDSQTGRVADINTIFFDEFFTILILIDVLLLLVSFLHLDKFNQVIRNSGFIISTILIKISFGVEGLLNTVLIVSAVLFGVIILAIHNQYEKIKTDNE